MPAGDDGTRSQHWLDVRFLELCRRIVAMPLSLGRIIVLGLHWRFDIMGHNGRCRVCGIAAVVQRARRHYNTYFHHINHVPCDLARGFNDPLLYISNVVVGVLEFVFRFILKNGTTFVADRHGGR